MPDEDITLLILNGVKRVRSIKVNRRRIRLTIFGISFVASLILISLGLNIYFIYVNNDYRFSLLPPQISGSESGTSIENELQIDSSAVDKGDGPPASMETGRDEVQDEQNIFANDHESEILEILNLNSTVEQNGNDLNISFSVSKKDERLDAVSGRFVIIARTTGTEKPLLSYPENVELNPDGTVRNFRAGETFYMRNVTHKKGRILITEKTASFKYYRIFIFSNDGVLLLQKTMSLSNNN